MKGWNDGRRESGALQALYSYAMGCRRTAKQIFKLWYTRRRLRAHRRIIVLISRSLFLFN